MTNINETMKELAEYIRMQEELSATIDALKDEIKAYMQEAGIDTVTTTEHKATWKTVSNSRIDTTAMKKAMPDIVALYTKTSESKRFTFA